MKRRNGGSSGALVGAAEERLIFLHDPENGEVGSGDGGFTSMVDDEDEEYGDDQELCSAHRDAGRRGSGAGADQDVVGGSGKKRRLSAEQVKALERNFEVENKLEPERKVRLAQELGLQPRQVAVWFQNRRARWKTKQLERDYVQLKANYGALQLSLDSLQADHRTLLSEVKELRAKFAGGDAPCTTTAVKEEPAASESGGKIACSEPDEEVVEPAEAEAEADHEEAPPPVPAPQACKDGSSTDSSDDSSAVLNACEDNTSARHGQHHSRDVAGLFPPVHKLQFLGPPPSTATFHPLAGGGGKCYAASATPFYHYGQQQTQQYLQHHLSSPSSPPPATRMVEEHNFLMEDDCGSTFFADEHLSTLPWYSSDQWS